MWKAPALIIYSLLNSTAVRIKDDLGPVADWSHKDDERQQKGEDDTRGHKEKARKRAASLGNI